MKQIRLSALIFYLWNIFRLQTDESKLPNRTLSVIFNIGLNLECIPLRTNQIGQSKGMLLIFSEKPNSSDYILCPNPVRLLLQNT